MGWQNDRKPSYFGHGRKIKSEIMSMPYTNLTYGKVSLEAKHVIAEELWTTKGWTVLGL